VLSRAVSPKKRWYQWSYGGGGFEGIVSRDGFKIERAISYRNSFLPILHGTFRPHVNGTQIEIVMKMHPVVVGFSIFWCSAVLSGLLISLSKSILSHEFRYEVLVTFGMLAAFYLMAILSFGFEVRKAIRLINDMFKEKVIT